MEKEEKKIASLTKKAGKRAAKSAGRLGGGEINHSLFGRALLTDADGHASTGDDSLSAGISNDLTEGEMSGTDKPKPKRPRSNRRHQTKSEPATQINDSLNGQQDSDLTAVSSGEGQPLLQNAAAVCHFTTNPA